MTSKHWRQAGVFIFFPLLLLAAFVSIHPSLIFIGFGSETAYRYLEAGRALCESGPMSAFAYLLPETSLPNWLWLIVNTVVYSICAEPLRAELALWLLTFVLWGAVVLSVAALAERLYGETWALLCAALLLSSGALLWGAVRVDEMGLLVLIGVGIVWARSDLQNRFSCLWLWLVLLAALGGPVGMGLAWGAVAAAWFGDASKTERITATGLAAAGCVLSLLLGASLNPAMSDLAEGFATLGATFAGGMLRGAWSARMDALWRIIGSLGHTPTPYFWLTGLIIAGGLAVLILPRSDRDTEISEAIHARRRTGITVACLLVVSLFAFAASAKPIDCAMPLVLPFIALAFTALIHAIWEFSRDWGAIPVSMLAALPIVWQLYGYSLWMQDAAEMALNQARVVKAITQEMEIEPYRQVAVADVPVIRWRLGETGHHGKTIQLPSFSYLTGGRQLVGDGETDIPYLEPKLQPWIGRKSPLSVHTGILRGWNKAQIGTQPNWLRWSPQVSTAYKVDFGDEMFPVPNGLHLLNPVKVWDAKSGIEPDTVRGFAPHLERWWRTASVNAGKETPSGWDVLTTETDGEGRSWGSVRSPEFELEKDTFVVRIACTRPDPECSFRLLVWQDTQKPLGQHIPVEEEHHIDLVDGAIHLQAELFAYDVDHVEDVTPMEDGGYGRWRVVKIIRGDELAPGLNTIVWPVEVWQGEKASWKLSDRSHSAAVSLDSVWMADWPALQRWDFERGDYYGWTVYQDAFGEHPVDRPFPGQQHVAGVQEEYFINSYLDGRDLPRGMMESWPFRIDGDVLSFKIGGGEDLERLCLELWIGGHRIARATGNRSETLRQVAWDVSACRDRVATIRIVDISSDVWGHILVDDIQLWPRENMPDAVRDVLVIPGHGSLLAQGR